MALHAPGRAGRALGKTLRPEQARWLTDQAGSNTTARMIPAVQAMRDFDSRPWLGSICSPTLIIAGGADTAVPAHHARMLADGIPGAQLQVIAGAGHLLLLTHTAEFLRLVEEFLGPGAAGGNTARSGAAPGASTGGERAAGRGLTIHG